MEFRSPEKSGAITLEYESGRPVAKLSRFRFVLTLLALIGSIAMFQIGFMELIIFNIMNPGLAEVKVLLTAPGPVVAISLSSFTVLIYLYIRPVPNFLARLARGEKPTVDEVKLVERRSLNFPYFMALFAFPFYMVGGALGTKAVCDALDWPGWLVYYGFIGGTLSSLLATPLSIYAYHWVTAPVVTIAAKSTVGLPPSRSEGFPLSIRMKLVITIFSLVLALTVYAALVGYTQTRVMADRVEEMVGEQSALESSPAANRLSELHSFFQERRGVLRIIYLTILGAGVLISLLLAYLAAKEITDPVRQIQEEADRVSRGNYDEPVYLISNDEFSELGVAFNRMVGTITGQMGTLSAVMDNLRIGIRRMNETVATVLEVSTGQTDGITEQAAAVQESGSIAEEIVATARQISERAGTVDQVAFSTLEACREGERKLDLAIAGFKEISGQVDEIVSAMQKLEDQFRQTYKIVELMEDIAEQTELLALNAALEAAGAGEDGKRFNVVAKATRRLSLRSVEAVQKIKSLVETIQRATQESVELVRAGQDKVNIGGQAISAAMSSLKNISSFAGSTSSAVREISLSTSQQTSASQQLATSIGQVQEVARRVEQGAHEIQSVINELKLFSSHLQQNVDS